jgi:hypothetical protein
MWKRNRVRRFTWISLTNSVDRTDPELIRRSGFQILDLNRFRTRRDVARFRYPVLKVVWQRTGNFDFRNFSSLHDVLQNWTVAIKSRRPTYAYDSVIRFAESFSLYVCRRERQLNNAQFRGSRFISSNRRNLDENESHASCFTLSESLFVSCIYHANVDSDV